MVAAALWLLPGTLLVAALSTPVGPAELVSLGGSNTCGHGVRSWDSFHDQLAARLRTRQHLNRCLPASGPVFVGMCVESMLPATARYVVVEYLPNIAYGSVTIAEEFEALGRILARVHKIGAHGVLLQIFPQYRKNPRRVMDLRSKHHPKMKAMATRHGLRTLEVDPTAPGMPEGLLGWDNVHLSRAGHALVAEWLAGMFLNQTAWAAAAAAARSAPVPVAAAQSTDPSVVGTGNRCYIGQQLTRAFTTGAHVQQVDMSAKHYGTAPWHDDSDSGITTLLPQVQDVARPAAHLTPKVGLEVRHPAGRIGLCVARNDEPHDTIKRTSSATVGVVLSHELNRPLMGVVAIECVGCACTCGAMTWPSRGEPGVCVYNALQWKPRRRVTVVEQLGVWIEKETNWTRTTSTAWCACELVLRPWSGPPQPAAGLANASALADGPPRPAERSRLIVRTLIFSHSRTVASSSSNLRRWAIDRRRRRASARTSRRERRDGDE